MIRLIGVTLLIAAALIVFNREKIEDYKQKIIETINPSIRERRLLGELENELQKFDSLANFETLSSADKQKLNSAVNSAKSALQELKEANQKTDLGANLSHLIQKIIPFESKPSPTWLPPGQECKN